MLLILRPFLDIEYALTAIAEFIATKYETIICRNICFNIYWNSKWNRIIYITNIIADTLYFTLVTDLCSNRTQVLTTYHWTRVYTVGIAENSLADLRIYPNPIADILFINIDTHEPSTVTLYDIASQKLLQETFTGNATLNTEQLADGVYIYEVLNKKGIVRKGKVIKQ